MCNLEAAEWLVVLKENNLIVDHLLKKPPSYVTEKEGGSRLDRELIECGIFFLCQIVQ